MAIETIECVVVGAGVIGLAIAREMAVRGHEVLVVDSADSIGTETSSRNSEVIHAGIYYPRNSLKARLCVAGRERLYAYCLEHGVAHDRIGKLIVAAAEDELPTLSGIREAAHENGVADVDFVTRAAVRQMEPDIRCVGALFSPSTGIVDSHGLMLAYQGDAESAGALVALRSRAIGGRVGSGPIELDMVTDDGPGMTLRCRYVFNSAGLGANALASRLSGLGAAHVPSLFLARGCYFTMSGRAPFRHLIYPVPTLASLGVHVTLDLAGQVRFGPDVEWIDTVDYSVDPARADAFYDSVRRYYPALPDDALLPGYAGVRPKLQAPGEPAADFRIDGPETHGIQGLVNLYGMESPGLTASLAIATYTADLVDA
jgi:L-2-hydroxyglutarate oxidase LhgO